MKNKYNPLNMTGSWIGAMVGFIYFLTNNNTCINYFTNPTVLGNLITKYTDICSSSSLLTSFIWTVGLGFLIGWGIHSLVRYSK